MLLEQPVKYLDEDSVAEMLGVQPQTLAKWRSSGAYNLPFVRVGRLVRYALEDINAWCESRKVGPSVADLLR